MAVTKTNRAKQVSAACKGMFNSKEGKIVLQYLKEAYLDSSPMDELMEKTYYNIGQQDLVRGLIAMLDEPEDLKAFAIKNTFNWEISNDD